MVNPKKLSPRNLSYFPILENASWIFDELFYLRVFRFTPTF